MTRFSFLLAGLAGALALAACSAEKPAPTADAQAVTQAAANAGGNKTPAEMDAQYGDFLATYISSADGINLVAYGDVSDADHASLKTYIASLETRGTDGLSRDEEMAFWFNLYNAKTIDVILDNYPLSSIRKIGAFNSGPWDVKNMNVKGHGEMSLNNVEHDTLRANWDEPRIHYAVNCASFGCPNLKVTPWTAATLEADLQTAAHDYINHPRGVRAEGGKIVASKIFKWYMVDFGGDKAGILAHVRQYATGDLKTALDAATTIDSFEYSWSLNEG